MFLKSKSLSENLSFIEIYFSYNRLTCGGENKSISHCNRVKCAILLYLWKELSTSFLSTNLNKACGKPTPTPIPRPLLRSPSFLLEVR